MMVSTTDQCKEFTLKKLASSRVQEDYKDNGPTAKKSMDVLYKLVSIITCDSNKSTKSCFFAERCRNIRLSPQFSSAF